MESLSLWPLNFKFNSDENSHIFEVKYTSYSPLSQLQTKIECNPPTQQLIDTLHKTYA